MYSPLIQLRLERLSSCQILFSFQHFFEQRDRQIIHPFTRVAQYYGAMGNFNYVRITRLAGMSRV